MKPKALILSTLLTLSSLSAFAGGITGTDATEMHQCGKNVIVGAEYGASSYDNNVSLVKPSDILASGFLRIEIREPQIIEKLKDQSLIQATNWDKTLWYKDLNRDINEVPDVVTLLVRENKVTSIGGGRTHYEFQKPVLTSSKINDVMLGSAPNAFFDIDFEQTGKKTFALHFNVVTGGVVKCVDSQIIPNPAVEFGVASGPATIVKCLKTERVSDQHTDHLITKLFTVDADSCTIPYPYSFL